MLDFGFYNMDCMEGMKQFPDKYFDLAIVDPPYGDGRGGNGTDSENGSKGTSIHKLGNAGKWATASRLQMGGGGVTRTGGTWAQKFGKKLLRGTSRRERNTSKNFSVSHETRLYGGAITSNSRQQDVFWYGAKLMSRKNLAWRWQNMLGHHLTETQKYLNFRR